MKTFFKPLFSLKNEDKFIHNGIIYTVYQHEGNMCEVFRNGEFSVWPTWNGKGPTMIHQLN